MLVRKFYVVYKGELKSQYPQGKLWKGGDHVSVLTIQGVWLYSYYCTIEKFLNGPEYQPSVNMGEIDYHLEEMSKTTQK